MHLCSSSNSFHASSLLRAPCYLPYINLDAALQRPHTALMSPAIVQTHYALGTRDHHRHSTMAAYLWLVWYHASSKMAPKHWALAITYEVNERAYATVYQMLGDGSGMGQFQPSVVRRVHLTGTHGAQSYEGKLLLGEVPDSVVGAMEMYSESATDLVNTKNRKRGVGESNCQDWTMIIVRSLEDAQLLPKGTLARVERSPRFG